MWTITEFYIGIWILFYKSFCCGYIHRSIEIETIWASGYIQCSYGDDCWCNENTDCNKDYS